MFQKTFDHRDPHSSCFGVERPDAIGKLGGEAEDLDVKTVIDLGGLKMTVRNKAL